MNNEILTQERLKELLHYCPVTGVFTWKTWAGRRVKIGDVAGHEHKNRKNYYRIIKILSKQYKAHRLAFLYITGELPINQVDHQDGNGLNNKWENLRNATNEQNSRNQRRRTDNRSGCTGVYFHKRDKKWIAQIDVNNKHVNLGSFADIFEAICARKSAENRYDYHVNHGRIGV